MLYSFQLLAFSDTVKELADTMFAFQTLIIFVSFIIVFVVAWLINYMNRFMLEKRGRELGTYMLLGISNRRITYMLLVEIVIVGSIAFFLGVIIGTFLYQIFLQIIMNIFKVPYKLSSPFSGSALALTGLFALLSYVFSMLKMTRKLRKIRICDMISLLEKNERKRKGIKNHWFVCIVAIILAIAGAIMFYLTCHQIENVKRALVAVVCFIVSIYLFYYSLSNMLIQLNVNNKKRKYTKDHLFIMRNLSSKMHSMKMTIGTLALLLMIALSAFQNALFLQEVFEVAKEVACPYDVYMVSSIKSYDYTKYDTYLKNEVGLKEAWIYPIYEIESETFNELSKQKQFSYDNEIIVMRNSDYQVLRKMKGYEEVKLEKGNYIVHGFQEIYEVFSTISMPELTVSDHSLQFQTVRKEPLPFFANNLFCVVADELVEELPIASQSYVALAERDLTKEEIYAICNLHGEQSQRPYIKLKTETMKQQKVESVTLHGLRSVCNKSIGSMLTIAF